MSSFSFRLRRTGVIALAVAVVAVSASAAYAAPGGANGSSAQVSYEDAVLDVEIDTGEQPYNQANLACVVN